MVDDVNTALAIGSKWQWAAFGSCDHKRQRAQPRRPPAASQEGRQAGLHLVPLWLRFRYSHLVIHQFIQIRFWKLFFYQMSFIAQAADLPTAILFIESRHACMHFVHWNSDENHIFLLSCLEIKDAFKCVWQICNGMIAYMLLSSYIDYFLNRSM